MDTHTHTPHTHTHTHIHTHTQLCRKLDAYACSKWNKALEMSVARKAIWNWLCYIVMLASVTEVSVHIVNETSRCTTGNPKMETIQTCMFANYRSVKECQTLPSIVTINLLHLQIGHPATSTKPCSQCMSHMTGEHCSGQRSERMKLKLSLHSQFRMVKMRISQNISYTDCLLVAWQHMQSTCLIRWCKSVLI